MSDKLEELANSGIGMPVMGAKEARELGMKFYWSGQPCARGHSSKRHASGSGCAACLHILNSSRDKRSLPTPKAVKEEALKQRAQYIIGERQRQKVLETYASTGSLEKAADAIKLTVAELNVQLAKSTQFSSALNLLEKRLSKVKEDPVYKPKAKVWTEKDYDTFIRAYIDTGDMASARTAVEASPSNYFDEIDRNPDFADRVREAEPKALQALEETAIQMARAGNYQLITLILKAKKPEYKDKIQIDQTNTTFIKVSDDTLNARILNLANRFTVIDGEVEPRIIEHEPKGERDTARLLGGTGQETDRKQVQLLLSRDGTTEPVQLPEAFGVLQTRSGV